MELFFISLVVMVLGCGAVGATVYVSQPQALQTAFPSYPTERRTVFLSRGQIQKIEQLSRTSVDSAIVSYYVARSSAGIEGIAFFDRRIVRNLPVTYMVVVKPDGSVDHVQILSFDEPDEYLPPTRWLDLYKKHALNDQLQIGHDIPHISGASLSSQAMNDGIRMLLATYQVAVQGTL